MPEYLEVGDEGCFQDMQKLEKPNTRYPEWYDEKEEFVECPKCHGYGGWNLQLNAYPRNPKYPHFRAHCGQCNGWGWVTKGSSDETCIHEMKEVAGRDLDPPRPQWNCYHYYVCQKCGRIREVDSSG